MCGDFEEAGLLFPRCGAAEIGDPAGILTNFFLKKSWKFFPEILENMSCYFGATPRRTPRRAGIETRAGRGLEGV